MSIHARPLDLTTARIVRDAMEEARPESDFDLVTVVQGQYVYIRETHESGKIEMHGLESNHHHTRPFA